MTRVVDVLKALATQISTVPTLSVSMGVIGGQVKPPQAFIGVPTIPSWRDSMAGGLRTIEPTITLLTSAALDDLGQLKMAEFLDASGPMSIWAAIEADRTLGGVVQDTRMVDYRPLNQDEYGGIGYYGGIFTVLVMIDDN